jgi:hypothetical protein
MWAAPPRRRRRPRRPRQSLAPWTRCRWAAAGGAGGRESGREPGQQARPLPLERRCPSRFAGPAVPAALLSVPWLLLLLQSPPPLLSAAPLPPPLPTGQGARRLLHGGELPRGAGAAGGRHLPQRRRAHQGARHALLHLPQGDPRRLLHVCRAALHLPAAFCCPPGLAWPVCSACCTCTCCCLAWPGLACVQSCCSVRPTSLARSPIAGSPGPPRALLTPSPTLPTQRARHAADEPPAGVDPEHGHQHADPAQQDHGAAGPSRLQERPGHGDALVPHGALRLGCGPPAPAPAPACGRAASEPASAPLPRHLPAPPPHPHSPASHPARWQP